MQKHAHLYATVEVRMRAQAYADWQGVMNELMVRTNEIRLLQRAGLVEFAEQTLRKYVELGFIWLPQTLECLQEYEANRKRYPTYETFIDRMFSVFDPS